MSTAGSVMAPASSIAGADEPIGEIVIPERFNGPMTSANGGYVSGRLAAWIPGPAQVTLRLPPPLERPLGVVGGERGEVRLLDGESVVAEAWAADPSIVHPPVWPTYEEAEAARRRHPGLGRRSALSDCFVCSPGRGRPGDGLRVSFGPVPGREDVSAAPFVPDRSLAGSDGVVGSEFIWAALDCPSYPPSMWATGRIALLGRLTVRREREVRVGERLVAVGWTVSAEGRKHLTRSALIDAGGEVVAAADAAWVEPREQPAPS